MSLYEYAIEFEPGKSARSQVYDQNVSYKDLTQVCRAIRGKPVEQARKQLEDAQAMVRPIPYGSHAKGVGHKSILGGKKGRFPKKECRLASKLLQAAVAAAQGKGLEPKSLIVIHACTYKQNVFPRYRREFAGSNTLGYGKQATMAAYTTARLELTVGTKDAKRVPRKTNAAVRKAAKARKAEIKATAKPPAKVEKKEVDKPAPAKAAETNKPGEVKA